MPLDPAAKTELEEAVADANRIGIVVGVQKLLAKLSSLGLLRSQQIAPQFVGTHPANRDGFGISATHTHGLLDDLCTVGFDHKQIDGICVDVASDEVYNFNHRLSEASGGALPPIPKQQLRHASLSASHTHAALRCIVAGTPHDSSSPLVVQGKLNLEQVGMDQYHVTVSYFFLQHSRRVKLGGAS